MKPPGKKVAVLGLGVSGYDSALFLKERGLEVFASDLGCSESLSKKAEELRRRHIKVETGVHTLPKLLECHWAVISPGIPPNSSVVQAMRSKGIPIFSEIEVASWYCSSDQVIAVTGSSGKTTVATLLGEVFRKTKGKSIVCGNIGNSWISELATIKPGDFVVVEISSFQLTYCESFRPKAGLLLNLSQNHQDWHPDMRDYAYAKLRLFQNQKKDDLAVVRKKDQVQYFPDFSFPSKVIYLDQIKSRDNNPNHDAVRLAAEAFHCPPQAVEEVLENFKGIEHRMEKFATKEGVQFVNDSKSTTTSSLIWALQKFPPKKVILIAGGHPKSNDFNLAADQIRQKVKKAILIGEARPLLREAWGKMTSCSEAEDFRSAVLQGLESAEEGDTLLLSPACASFDMFQNYKERGSIFKEIVQEKLAQKISSAVSSSP